MSFTKWKVLSSSHLVSGHFFNLKVDKCELPDGRIMPKYYVMGFPDWVNIVAVTKAKEVILLRQYRHAAEGVFWEIPGGTTHPGQNEDPLLAAKRELLEETGYESTNWTCLGHSFPNPALQSNKTQIYLALDCEKVAEQNLDEFEEIEVVLKSPTEVISMLKNGEITHSIIAASLVRSLFHLEKI